MFNKIRNWRVRRIVARHPIAESLWRDALQRCAPARRLGASDQATLRVLATLFLESKSLEPTKGLQLDDADLVLLATHACVPILKLGIDWYDGWHSIIVYPDAFIPRRTKNRRRWGGSSDQHRDGR
jgi:Mlc titration factor MtfA (ptsG expression regulator)